MKRIASTLIFIVLILGNLFSQNSSVFKNIEVYYLDSITEDKSIMRELTYIGEEPFYSKPQKLDLKIELNEVNLNGSIEVFIEEFMVPDTININRCEDCSDTPLLPYWCINRVVQTYYFNNKRKGSIEIKDVNYQTAYFLSSKLY